jgi:type I restriction-modification system DNA methylase subunit
MNIEQLIKQNIGNRTELSKLIDKYLIPQELEKKTNAEVSTPYKLRQDMLDKIPDNFWTDIRRVFEPCSGKGGFLIDILDRFMIGLKDKIIDDQVRYKTIVEQCLYWSDINPTNIFICKLLLDPENKHKLNYNEGDTLNINIFDKFGFDHFDAVIGNPPYNMPKESVLKGGYGGRSLWEDY